jgi:stringent starvation protein B
MSPTQPPPKKDVALALLERSSLSVHLDPRPTAVVVPPGFKKQPQLVLQVGLNMPVPIPDLRLDDEGMSCTLSFNRTPFFCVVPWSSVFAMVGEDSRGMVWPDDVPVEVTRGAQDRGPDGTVRRPAPKVAPVREARAEASKPKRARKRPALAAVPNGAEPASGERSDPVRVLRHNPAITSVTAAKRAADTTRKRRELPPYLRVVK